jgi:hypothetical protein
MLTSSKLLYSCILHRFNERLQAQPPIHSYSGKPRVLLAPKIRHHFCDRTIMIDWLGCVIVLVCTKQGRIRCLLSSALIRLHRISPRHMSAVTRSSMNVHEWPVFAYPQLWSGTVQFSIGYRLISVMRANGIGQ